MTTYEEDEVRIDFEFHGVSCGLSNAHIEYSGGFGNLFFFLNKQPLKI